MYYDDNQFSRIKKCLKLILCDKQCITTYEYRNLKNNIGFFVDSSLFFSPQQCEDLKKYLFKNEKGDLLYVSLEI